MFTTKYEGPELFGKFAEISPICNEKLIDIQMTELLHLNETNMSDGLTIKRIWDELSDVDKKSAIIAADSDMEKGIDKWLKRANEKEDKWHIRNIIWEKEKRNIIGKLHGASWSVYAAVGHDGVYALHCLPKGIVPPPKKEWAETLIKICKILNPESKNINLVIHDDDFGSPYDEYKMYVFTDSDYKKTGINELKEKYAINELNIITFQHWNGEPIPRILNNEHSYGSVHEAIKKIVEKRFK